MVKLHFNNGSIWEYELLSITNKYIHMHDKLGGTSIRYDKDKKELSQYDEYNSFWKYMPNTTGMLDKVEIIEEVEWDVQNKSICT